MAVRIGWPSPYRIHRPFQLPWPFLRDFAKDGILLLGTNEDGVLRSADQGRTWASWNFGLVDFNVLCLAISPAFDRDETVFAGTGSGLFLSRDGRQILERNKITRRVCTGPQPGHLTQF